jgi:anti-sigma-K factor RskA
VNIKEYISSGIVESYVLGLASTEERTEFEVLCRQYPELVQARNEFEITIEETLLASGTVSPGNVKEGLMNTIRQDFPINEKKLVVMENTSRSNSFSPMRWVAAASIVLLLGASYFAYDFYNRNQQLLNDSQALQARIEKLEQDQRMMSDPNVAVVNLVGTTPAKVSASVYWDTASADVFLVVKNMPKLPSDKQYQLWSIINGQDGGLQPSSLGLFDVGDDGKIMLKMSNTNKADAFAITIENKGNQGGPTLEQLQTMGKTKL